MSTIGAHVSASVSLDLSFERAQNIGAQATQIFISPPQQWYQTKHDDKEISSYRTKGESIGIKPNFIHGAYLINLASENSFNVQKSIEWLIYSQKTAHQLGIAGTIFHIGSAGKQRRGEAIKKVSHGVEQILTATPEVDLILETSAGSGNTIGDEFSEIGEIIKNVGDSRVKVCLDTQHIFASGYDIRTKEGVEKTIAEFNREVGLKKLVVIHTNDSKTELGSHKDRHENIGEGFIGKDAFGFLLNHQALKNIPFILEVPGFAGDGPDVENINLLKNLSL